MKKCKQCGKQQEKSFCTRACRGMYNKTAVRGRNTCRICGNKFDVTHNTKDSTVCKRAGCRTVIANKKKSLSPKEGAAPAHIRRTYCIQQRESGAVRCKIHHDTCSEGCYREQNGRPCCRVEPDRVAPTRSYYRSSLAGASAALGI